MLLQRAYLDGPAACGPSQALTLPGPATTRRVEPTLRGGNYMTWRNGSNRLSNGNVGVLAMTF